MMANSQSLPRTTRHSTATGKCEFTHSDACLAHAQIDSEPFRLSLACSRVSCPGFRLRTKNMRTRSTRSLPHMTHTPAHTHDITVTRVTTVWSPPWAPHTHNTYAHPQIDSTHMRVNAYRVSDISAIATNPHPRREASQTTPYPTLRTCTYQENQKYQPARRYIDHA